MDVEIALNDRDIWKSGDDIEERQKSRVTCSGAVINIDEIEKVRAF